MNNENKNEKEDAKRSNTSFKTDPNLNPSSFAESIPSNDLPPDHLLDID